MLQKHSNNNSNYNNNNSNHNYNNNNKKKKNETNNNNIENKMDYLDILQSFFFFLTAIKKIFYKK